MMAAFLIRSNLGGSMKLPRFFHRLFTIMSISCIVYHLLVILTAVSPHVMIDPSGFSMRGGSGVRGISPDVNSGVILLRFGVLSVSL